MVRSVALLFVGRLLGVLGRGPVTGADAVEIAVLRHQLAVLRRQVPVRAYPYPRRPGCSWPGQVHAARCKSRTRWAGRVVESPSRDSHFYVNGIESLTAQ